MILSLPQSSRGFSFSEKPEIEKFFTDSKIRQALALALKNDFKKTEQFLIENKIDINRPGYLLATPMHFVLIWSNEETIKIFVKHGANPFEMAYGYGSPLQNLLTSTLDLKTKLSHVEALIQAGVDFSSLAALSDIDNFIRMLDRKTAYTFAEILIKNGLRPEAIDDEGQSPFQNSNDLQLTELLLKNKFPLYSANGVGHPLALKAYMAVKLPSQSEDQSIKNAILEELQKQKIELTTLESMYGPMEKTAGSLKFYRKNFSTLQPWSMNLHVRSTRNQYAPKVATELPYQITFWLQGEKASQLTNKDLNFLKLLENIKLEIIVANQPRRFLSSDLKYVKNLKETRKDPSHLIIDFNLALLFPELVKVKEEIKVHSENEEKYAIIFLASYENSFPAGLKSILRINEVIESNAYN